MWNCINIDFHRYTIKAGEGKGPCRIWFAITVTLSQGVPLETVSKMLGHKHITITQIYAKITNDKIGRNMDALEAKIGGKFSIAQ